MWDGDGIGWSAGRGVHMGWEGVVVWLGWSGVGRDGGDGHSPAKGLQRMPSEFL